MLMTKWPHQRPGKAHFSRIRLVLQDGNVALRSVVLYFSHAQRGEKSGICSPHSCINLLVNSQCSSVAASHTTQPTKVTERVRRREMSRLQRRRTVENCAHHHSTPQDKCRKPDHILHTSHTRAFSQDQTEVKQSAAENRWCDRVVMKTTFLQASYCVLVSKYVLLKSVWARCSGCRAAALLQVLQKSGCNNLGS